MNDNRKSVIFNLMEFRTKILSWYHTHGRDLPWRKNPTPYRIWISEIMLQQTQSTTVIPYYDRFLKRFPDVKSLARASEQEVLSFWSGLGYYLRACNLHRSAKEIVRTYKEFPCEFGTILSLPGIGRYTAGAICSFAFNQAQPVVDGNIRRVVARLKGLKKHPPESYYWNQMQAWLPDGKSSSFNQAMMELGALICIPSMPRCPKCPVRRFCRAYQTGTQNRIPRPRAKRRYEHTEIVALVLGKKGRILLTSRYLCDFIPGKWGIPSQPIQGKKSPEETAQGLCRKILKSGIPLRPCSRFDHGITRYRIRVYGFRGNSNLPAPRSEGSGSFRWVERSALRPLLTSSLYHKVLQACGKRSRQNVPRDT